MAQQPKLVRVKAKKMFKAVVEGSLPTMLNPGDVVDVDQFMAGMLIQCEKAELTDEKLRINKDYVATQRPATAGLDPMGAILRAIESLTGTIGTLAVQKGR
jgi:hypothetical protein